MEDFNFQWHLRPTRVVDLPHRRGRAYLTGCSLGEGPLWHDHSARLIWFDIKGQTILRLNPETGVVEAARLPIMPSAAAILGPDTLLMAAEDGLYTVPLDGGRCKWVLPIEHGNPSTRSNDCRVDPAGHFWVGTMGRNGENGAGTQYRLAPDGTLTTLFSNITVPNSTAFDAQKGQAWVCDSRSRIIRTAPLDVAAGTLGTFSNFGEVSSPAVPDGSVCDAHGRLWTALWNGACVVRWSSSGRIAETFPLPAQFVTCPAFGGPEMDLLFVTSARADKNGHPSAASAYDGALFTLDVGTRGLPEPRYSAHGWF